MYKQKIFLHKTTMNNFNLDDIVVCFYERNNIEKPEAYELEEEILCGCEECIDLILERQDIEYEIEEEKAYEIEKRNRVKSARKVVNED